jgi:hypothetical protein
MDFVLTADMDWASESCIEGFLALTGAFGILPTLFVTHASAAASAAATAGRAELAIHPNFLPGSSHGETIREVLDHVLALVPGARVLRSHRYVDSEAVQDAAADRGLLADSNECRHLEPGLGARPLPSGLRRLPVFFEDDVHWTQQRSWRFAHHSSAFFAPGLKLLNFHPFFVALNIPDAAFYERHRPLITGLTAGQATALRYPGLGTRTFLLDALRAIASRGHRFVPLSALLEPEEMAV